MGSVSGRPREVVGGGMERETCRFSMLEVGASCWRGGGGGGS